MPQKPLQYKLGHEGVVHKNRSMLAGMCIEYFPQKVSDVQNRSLRGVICTDRSPDEHAFGHMASKDYPTVYPEKLDKKMSIE